MITSEAALLMLTLSSSRVPCENACQKSAFVIVMQIGEREKSAHFTKDMQPRSVLPTTRPPPPRSPPPRSPPPPFRRKTVVAAANNGGAKTEGGGVLLVEIVRYFTRPLKCESCFGYNRVVCDVCRGRGTNRDDFFSSEKTTTTTTTERNGEKIKESSCEKCDGRGYVGCDACKRTGLKNGWLFEVKGGWGSRGE